MTTSPDSSPPASSGQGSPKLARESDDDAGSLEGWQVVEDPLGVRPSYSCTRRFPDSYAPNTAVDDQVSFTFRSITGAPEYKIHESRLVLAGGPLAAMISSGFLESRTQRVELSSEDDPETFELIRNFLYCKPICLEDKDLSFILRAIQNAHRWQLMNLFHLLCRVVAKQRLITTGLEVVDAAVLMQLSDVPPVFSAYFWESAVEYFFELREGHHDEDEIDEPEQTANEPKDPRPINERLCPLYPDIWKLALSKNCLRRFMNEIRQFLDENMKEALLMLMLTYLEPHIEDDDAVVALLGDVLSNISYAEKLCGDSGLEEACSPRALRLLARSLLSPFNAEDSICYEWPVDLWSNRRAETSILFGGSCFNLKEGRRQFYWKRLINFDIKLRNIESENKLSVSISWDIGPKLRKDRYLDMQVALLEAHCFCSASGYRELSGTRMEYLVTKRAYLSNDGEFIAFTVPGELLSEFKKVHKESQICEARLRFRATLKHRKVKRGDEEWMTYDILESEIS